MSRLMGEIMGYDEIVVELRRNHIIFGIYDNDVIVCSESDSRDVYGGIRVAAFSREKFLTLDLHPGDKFFRTEEAAFMYLNLGEVYE